MTVGDKNVSLPHVVNNVVIEQVSNYVITYGYNGISVLWDGIDAVYVHVSANHRNRTCGLCGNYNGFPDDDVMTYGGQQVSSIAKFGNSWRMTDVNDFCPNVRDEETKSPCSLVTQGNMTQVTVTKHCKVTQFGNEHMREFNNKLVSSLDVFTQYVRCPYFITHY